MRVGILGSGLMGGKLGALFARAGHEVVFSYARSKEKLDRLARDAGAYIVVGQYTDNGDATFNPHLDLNRKHLRVQGVWGSDYSHVHRALLVLQRYNSEVPWTDFLSKTYSLDEMDQAIDDVANARVIKAAVKPNQ